MSTVVKTVTSIFAFNRNDCFETLISSHAMNIYCPKCEQLMINKKHHPSYYPYFGAKNQLEFIDSDDSDKTPISIVTINIPGTLR